MKKTIFFESNQSNNARSGLQNFQPTKNNNSKSQ